MKRLHIVPLVRSLALVGLIVFILLVAPVHAAPIDLSNNLINAPGSGTFITSSSWAAQAFATDATHTYITTVVIGLCSTTATSGTYAVEIGDANGAGGALGSKVADVAPSASATNFNRCGTLVAPGPTFSGLAIALAPSTTYYLVVRGVTSSTFSWAYGGGGTGFPSNRSSFDGSSWSAPTTQLPQMMRIVAESGIPTTTTLTGPSGNYTSAQAFTFTATVASPSACAPTGSNTAPVCAPTSGSNAKTSVRAPKQTGTVTFYDNAVAIPSCTNVPLIGDVASCTVTLQPGTHVITAVYNGDTIYASSTSDALPLTITVAPREVPEGDTLLLLGGGIGGLATWVRWQWGKRKKVG